MSKVGEAAVADVGELLARYSPFVQYDSLEVYSADSPATMSDCETVAHPHGNVLVHGGHELAAAGATRREAVLDLAFLHGGHYPDAPHTAVAADDYIDVVGKEYIAEAHAMHLLPGVANQVYGHAAHDREGGLWLQYWFFYYYNDKASLGMGLHEGDWEMVQLRIGASGEPDVVTYAQHKRGERCAWEDVEKEGGAPVVYSARGSHASYLRRGNHATEVPLIGWDYNDAGGPLARPQVNVITDNDPAWVAWPGRWGSTRVEGEVIGFAIGDDSPVGPRRHSQWSDPLKFHEEAVAARSLAPVVGTNLVRPSSPSVAATRAGDRAGVSFTFPALAGTPPLRAVLVSLDGAGDHHAPTTVLFEPPPADGHVDFPFALGPRAYPVRVSGVERGGAHRAGGQAACRRRRRAGSSRGRMGRPVAKPGAPLLRSRPLSARACQRRVVVVTGTPRTVTPSPARISQPGWVAAANRVPAWSSHRRRWRRRRSPPRARSRPGARSRRCRRRPRPGRRACRRSPRSRSAGWRGPSRRRAGGRR